MRGPAGRGAAVVEVLEDLHPFHLPWRTDLLRDNHRGPGQLVELVDQFGIVDPHGGGLTAPRLAQLNEVIDAINQSSEHVPPEVRLVAVRPDRELSVKVIRERRCGIVGLGHSGSVWQGRRRGTPRRRGVRAAVATTADGPVVRHLLCLQGKHLGRDADFPALRGLQRSRRLGLNRRRAFPRRVVLLAMSRALITATANTCCDSTTCSSTAARHGAGGLSDCC